MVMTILRPAYASIFQLPLKIVVDPSGMLVGVNRHPLCYVAAPWAGKKLTASSNSTQHKSVKLTKSS